MTLIVRRNGRTYSCWACGTRATGYDDMVTIECRPVVYARVCDGRTPAPSGCLGELVRALVEAVVE